MADQDRISEVEGQSGNMIVDLEAAKAQIISIDAQLGELILQKQQLLGMIEEAHKIILEIFSLGKTKLDTPIDELEFSTATKMPILNALRSLNVKTIGDLSNESEESLKKAPTLVKAIDEIHCVLAKHGLSLKSH